MQGESMSSHSTDSKQRTATYLLMELRSLGICVKRTSEFNDMQELQDFVDNIKQVLFQEYKTVYRSDERSNEEDEEELLRSSSDIQAAAA